jgi:hypothetical protein
MNRLIRHGQVSSKGRFEFVFLPCIPPGVHSARLFMNSWRLCGDTSRPPANLVRDRCPGPSGLSVAEWVEREIHTSELDRQALVTQG